MEVRRRRYAADGNRVVVPASVGAALVAAMAGGRRVSTLHRQVGPLPWDAPSDRQVQAALDRQRDLFRRAGEAQRLAREASEAAAGAAQEHSARRAAQLAEGGADLGAFDPASVNSAAASATETAEALDSAAVIARAARRCSSPLTAKRIGRCRRRPGCTANGARC